MLSNAIKCSRRAVSLPHTLFEQAPPIVPKRFPSISSPLHTSKYDCARVSRQELALITCDSRKVSAFVSRQSAVGACTDAIVFNFENPSLHGHGAQVLDPFLLLFIPHAFNFIQVLSPSVAGAHDFVGSKAGAFNATRAAHQHERTMGIQQVCCIILLCPRF